MHNQTECGMCYSREKFKIHWNTEEDALSRKRGRLHRGGGVSGGFPLRTNQTLSDGDNRKRHSQHREEKVQKNGGSDRSWSDWKNKFWVTGGNEAETETYRRYGYNGSQALGEIRLGHEGHGKLQRELNTPTSVSPVSH